MKQNSRFFIWTLLGALLLMIAGVTAAQDPSVTITTPTGGTIVDINNWPLTVSGTSTGLSGTAQIQVQARSATNVVLEEEIVPVQSDGSWTADITITQDITPGDAGNLIAYALDNGRTEAESPVVNVQYGEPTTPPSIAITVPTDGVSLDVDTGVTVNGTTSNRPTDSTVIVRSFKGDGTLLGEINTGIGADGSWGVTYSLSNGSAVTADTAGYIEAYLVVGGIGNTVASDRVDVTWTPSVTPAVIISYPTSGANLNVINNPLVGNGLAGNFPAGAKVRFRARDAGGATLGEQIVNVGIDGKWAVNFSLTTKPANNSTGTVIAHLLDATNAVIATSATVSVTYIDIPATPTINITFPANFITVDFTTPFNISGVFTNLPANAKIQVQVGDRNGAVIGVGEILNPTSPWSVPINWTRTPVAGESVSTTAYLIDKTTSAGLGKSPQVNFTFRTGNQPFVRINSPLNNAIVPNRFPIAVQGTQFGSFESNVVVRAVNSFGTVLTQQAVTADAAGNWSASLTVNVPDGTLGSIVAFFTSARDGSVVASARVDVSFGAACIVRSDLIPYTVQRGDTLLKLARATNSTVQELALYNCLRTPNVIKVGQLLYLPRIPATPVAPQSTIRIITPLNNATLNATSPIQVRGAGQNLTGNTIIIRALDANGNILTEQTTTATGGGAEQNFEQAINVNVTQTTQGSIAVFARNSAGVLVVDDIINVTFSVPTETEDDEEETGAPSLEFTNVPPDSIISENSIVAVTGRGQNISGSPVFVRALDASGRVISEAEAELTPTDDGFDWRARVLVRDVETERGIFVAYATASIDGRIVAITQAPVLFGEPTDAPFVTLEDPLPYTTLALDHAIEITGRVGNTDGDVIVRAVDHTGHVLTEDVAERVGDEYLIQLEVNAAVGTRGKLIAIALADDGTVGAQQAIPVIFGDATSNTLFVQVTVPLDGADVTGDTSLTVSGIVDARSGSRITVELLDEDDNVLTSARGRVIETADPNVSIWGTDIGLPVELTGTFKLRVHTASPVDGETLAEDTITIHIRESDS